MPWLENIAIRNLVIRIGGRRQMDKPPVRSWERAPRCIRRRPRLQGNLSASTRAVRVPRAHLRPPSCRPGPRPFLGELFFSLRFIIDKTYHLLQHSNFDRDPARREDGAARARRPGVPGVPPGARHPAASPLRALRGPLPLLPQKNSNIEDAGALLNS